MSEDTKSPALQGEGEDLEFTLEAVAKYKEYPVGCPHCASSDVVSGGKEELDIGEISVLVHCNGCRRSWWEIYTIRTIEPAKHGPVAGAGG